MSSTVEDMDAIPDLSSMIDNELESGCRLAKDSSNDEDMFADSSGEESLKTFDFTNDMLSTISSAIDSSKNEVADNELQLNQALKAADSVATVAVSSYPTQQNKAHLLTEETASTSMTDEEHEFFVQYSKASSTDGISNPKCTICSEQLFVLNPSNIRNHPVLGVLICKECLEFYNAGHFTKDDEGHDEYCRWCGEGGLLICCDVCTNVFCKACLRRCLGRNAYKDITNSSSAWNCLVCNTIPLWSLRAESRMIMTAMQKNSRLHAPSGTAMEESGNEDDPSVWLPACLAEVEKLATRCKTIASKVGNNLAKRSGDASKDDAETNLDKNKVVTCCRQLRKAVSVAQTHMETLEKKIVGKYTRTYGSAVEIEVDSSSDSSDSSTFSPNSENTPSDKRLVLKIKNFRDPNRSGSKQDFYAEICGSSNSHQEAMQTVNRAENSKIPEISKPTANVEDSTQKSQVENDAVKLEPIDSADFHSSDFDPLELLESGPTITEIDNVEVKIGMPSNSPILKRKKQTEAIPSKGKESSKSKPKNLDKNEKARRDLLKDSSGDSDDSSADIKIKNNPRMKKTSKRSRTLSDDAKLKSECAVLVNKITATTTERNAEFEDAKLKKKIDRLGSSIVNNSTKADSISGSADADDDADDETKDRKNGETKKKSKSKPKKEKKRNVLISDSSSSGSEPEPDSPIESDVEMKTSTPAKQDDPLPLNRNEAVRQQLLASSASDISDLDDEIGTDRTCKVGKDAEEEAQSLEETTANGNKICDSSEDDNVAEAKVSSDEQLEASSGDEMKETGSVKSSKLLKFSLADDDADADAGEKDEEAPAKEKNGEEKKKKKEKKERKKRRVLCSDSDFESSDEEVNSKKKRKKKKSASSEEEEEEIGESKPKRRRRIKKAETSGDEEDSDVQILNESQRSGENGDKKGRKNIKKIIKDKNLKDATKQAAKEEEERKRRIADRQKCYNAVFTGEDALSRVRIDHLVLDFDPKTKKELVVVEKQLTTKLKPHQVKGVKFMWDACFESCERLKEHPGSGCILAHCMGLGKSLQVVTLVNTLLTNDNTRVKRALVVCPLSTVLNWVNEFKIWLPGDLELDVFELSSVKSNDIRMFTLRNWFEDGGVMILGYDMYRNLTNEKNKKVRSKMREVFQQSLVDPGPDIVICDEGHLLKNEVTALSKAMNRIKTLRRVVLTGTPLQNSLMEYHCMIQFVKPNLLGTKREFTNRFANPIKNGQAADSTDYDVRIMKRRAHVLHKMLEDSVQRFDYSVLTPFLPPKHEYVISVKMSDLQIKMYQYYLDHCAKGGPNASMAMGRGKGSGLFADFQELGRVWTHPKALHISQMRRELKEIHHSDSEGSIADFLDDRSESELDEAPGVVNLDESDDDDKSDDEDAPKNGWGTRTRSGRGNQPPPIEELGVTAPLSGSWWSQFVGEDDLMKIEHSGKLTLLMDILRQCELIGDKILVFSQSLVSLDLIEEFLAAENERLEENRSILGKDVPFGSWQLNADYFRLDGSTTAELRRNWCNIFNNASNLRARLFLISTRAGGLGINLVAANRVIIFDASWNPSHDVQSIFRVYRFGQKKPCYVYRFLAQGTMEEKIYDRQVTKLSLSCRVVDEQQIERHFNSADLNELYLFEHDSHKRRPTPIVPKDRMLAELTIQRKEWIVTFHEHDSLLENKSDEELNETERKAAWDDFENEKRGIMNNMPPDAAGFLGIPEMMGLSGRSVAGIPLNNIAAMIYNSNPGISQDEFLGRLRLTVDQLQNFSVQQAAAAATAQNPLGLQQPGDAQRLLMQRQVAAEQLKRQFGNGPQPGGVPGIADSGPGPSGVVIAPRSRGRPTIGPHQRTDLYGLAPVILNTAQQPKDSVRKTSSLNPGKVSTPKS